MGLESALIQYIITGIIGAIIGSIFGASGLLFFPLKRFMEKRLEKAEKDANERIESQKKMFLITSEERSATSRYLFWLKEALVIILDNCVCSTDKGDYWKQHIEEAAEELIAVEKKRKEFEREQLADINVDKNC
jgi:ATP/ADP translocase